MYTKDLKQRVAVQYRSIVVLTGRRGRALTGSWGVLPAEE
jgi:hypothetical protein